MIDETHDPGLASWVGSAHGHPTFPIQNLPFGVFAPPGGSARDGVAIGDQILDLGAALEVGLFASAARDAAELAAGRDLNAFLGAGGAAHRPLRQSQL
jgi:fumarylacetoacetase